ncbi:DUF4157 domain-containing protein [Cellulosimicrobium protaetiae]|uniref:eCIS core domain-containing protein n=1 Tax=Cellulosimicrobium protaetiae TaxID=2587808 RepID=UPI0020A3C741|nr:DUF4157 domain-containing protein [Cellulosimicrobium protaetiae]
MDVGALGVEDVAALQRHLGNEALQRVLDGARSPVLDVVGRGGGSPLAPDVREDMESRLGADFSDVRVHTGGTAASSAATVGAHAYTVGRDVVFGAGKFDTTSTAGRTMLAHELTHVVQQRSGPVSGTPTGDGVSISDPGDRFEREAEATAARVMRVPVRMADTVLSGGRISGRAIQRTVAFTAQDDSHRLAKLGNEPWEEDARAWHSSEETYTFRNFADLEERAKRVAILKKAPEGEAWAKVDPDMRRTIQGNVPALSVLVETGLLRHGKLLAMSSGGENRGTLPPEMVEAIKFTPAKDGEFDFSLSLVHKVEAPSNARGSGRFEGAYSGKYEGRVGPAGMVATNNKHGEGPGKKIRLNDLLFAAYRAMFSEAAPKELRREAVVSNDGVVVLGYARSWYGRSARAEVGPFSTEAQHRDLFYAMLGSANGAAALHLVLQQGALLAIKAITGATIDVSESLFVFHFA